MIVHSSHSTTSLEQDLGTTKSASTWRWTADQFLRMIQAGVINESDRIELINGEIVCMSPAEVDHNRTVSNLNRYLISVMESHEVLIQSTVRLSETSIVDPDIAILKRPNSQDQGKLPTPDDVLLLIEAAHSSINRDLKMKSELYARALIPEYWVADIQNKTLIVHRESDGQRYGTILTLHADEPASPLAIPNLSLNPAAIFG